MSIGSRRSTASSVRLSAVETLLKFFHTSTGLELMPGVVAVIQTFGDRINFHPHIHCLVTEGGAAPDGIFHHVSRFHDEVIQEIFTHEVFSLLLREKLIGLIWRHRVNCAAFWIFDLGVFDVIPLFEDVSGWKLRKIVRDLPQAQKRNSYQNMPV